MQITASLLGFLMPSRADSPAGTIATRSKGGSAGAATRDPLVALKDAEKNRDKQIAAKANEPQVKREIAGFLDAVAEATTVDGLLSDRRFQKVFLAANGLESFANYRGLILKALKSDPTDPGSVAAKLANTTPGWLSAARTYDFARRGLDVIKQSATQFVLADAYAEVRWIEGLDSTAPGVSAALAFKDMAATLDSPFKILGNGVARSVVTTVLGLPPQLAYQSESTQARAITSRLDLDKLQNPRFVDAFVRQYLIRINGGASGAVA